MMCGAAIDGWSYKQMMVTRHSKEAEIVGLTDGLSEVIWSKKWLNEQGHSVSKIRVYQDNEAVLKLMKSDRRTHQRTKHLDARYFYARELEENKEIEIMWTPTAHMIADLMTKPLIGKSFAYLSDCITGYGQINLNN